MAHKKKKYYQSLKDRMHESMGEKRHMRKMDHEYREEGMIHEDHHAIANLPQEVRIRPYPMTGPYEPEMLDDTIRGIDRQIDGDERMRSRLLKPRKA